MNPTKGQRDRFLFNLYYCIFLEGKLLNSGGKDNISIYKIIFEKNNDDTVYVQRQHVTLYFILKYLSRRKQLKYFLQYTANTLILEVRTCRGRQENWTCGNVTFFKFDGITFCNLFKNWY